MSGGRLRIGLSARILHEPPPELGFRGKTLQYLEQSIAHWLLAHDALAFMIPAIAQGAGVSRASVSLGDYVRALDGLVLQGGNDVAPECYGESPLHPDWAGDAVRDKYEIELIDAFVRAGKPVFGVCRGFQEINVALGGTLRRDVSASDGLLRHHAPDGVAFDAMFDHMHPVHLSEGGMLARAYGKEELTVNSVHFQGVGRLAEGLDVEARAPDGLVEAYSAKIGAAPVLAVQWHPEWKTDANPESQAFFRLLGQVMRGA